LLKQLALFPLLATAIFIFSQKSLAQQKPALMKVTAKAPPSTITGVTAAMMAEYETIINKYKEGNSTWMITFCQKVSAAERERLKTIFLQMNKEQQENQNVRFDYGTGRVLPKCIPTKAQFEAFKNASVYGVWINNKKVSNDALNKYTNTDFEQFFVSKLYGAAKTNKPYTHQLNLMTIDFYRDYCKATAEEKNILSMHVTSLMKIGN